DASPSALITIGTGCDRTYSRAGSSASNVRYSAVGMPWRARNAFVKAFEPSSCAAAAPGPKQRKPAPAKRSATPATRGGSGPTIVRSARSASASSTSASTSVAATATFRVFGSRAVPALPGATRTSRTSGDCAAFHAIACSRPPPPMIRTFTTATSVAEMANAGQHHRDTVLVRRADDFLVADRPARLDHRADAEGGGDVDAVPEREERVGRHRRAGERQPGFLGLEAGYARAHHACRLPGTDPERRAVPGVDDRVRLDEPDDPPRELEIAKLRLRRRALRDDLERRPCRGTAVPFLQEQPAADAAELEPGRVGGGAGERLAFEDADALLLCERAARAVLDSRRDDHVGLLPAEDRLRGGL